MWANEVNETNQRSATVTMIQALAERLNRNTDDRSVSNRAIVSTEPLLGMAEHQPATYTKHYSAEQSG